MASHLPPNGQALAAPNPRQGANSRNGNGNGANKRPRAAQNNEHHASTPADQPHEPFIHPPSASAAHPSLPHPFGHALNGMGEWTPGQLEGPGMPVARTFIGPAVPGDENEGTAAPTGEGEGEGDDGKTYCVCNGVSYGEMIACDDSSCETEWVRLIQQCVSVCITERALIVPLDVCRPASASARRVVLRSVSAQTQRPAEWARWQEKVGRRAFQHSEHLDMRRTSPGE